MKNKRYIIIITRHDTDGSSYVESFDNTFTNKKKAQDCVRELMQEELTNLDCNFIKKSNRILDRHTEYVVSEYEIHDVITEYK